MARYRVSSQIRKGLNTQRKVDGESLHEAVALADVREDPLLRGYLWARS